MQEWYLGWEKVSCLERCPQFRSVLIERERFHCSACWKTTLTLCVYDLEILYTHHSPSHPHTLTNHTTVTPSVRAVRGVLRGKLSHSKVVRTATYVQPVLSLPFQTPPPVPPAPLGGSASM